MSPDEDGHGEPGFSRRGFLGGGVAAAAVPLLAPAAGAAPATAAGDDGLVDVRIEVNGDPSSVRVDPRATLLDTLRERLELCGTKKGCDRGQCGACTVHVDGRRVLSCLTLTATVDGAEVTTIEGLAQGDELHPMQRAFIEHDGFQCGFCTPGQIMSAVAMVHEGPAGSDDEIRERMSGNICRCSAYPFIVDAIRDAQQVMR
ncbi:(2Fe-2S)-binding protein [Streptomyces marincola]|uniref:Oxidoreductase n=1 Tax=Streptomyces marincola TaxID=2878388 RepID=A0A1W7CWF3_9ACTN|nr:(2Fe-2S)-binding protein [Streptomyces marincola]ARQ69131.1 oxidoreductase [Streptomyces marincola]